MLTKDLALAESVQPARTASRAAHTYPTRNSNMDSTLAAAKAYLGHSAQRGRPLGRTEAPLQREPEFASYTPKTINFQLLLSNAGQYRARLPLRIRLGFQDGSDKIVETVKSFYGLYEGEGVSFEDGNGRTVVAQYDSLPNNATIFVRVVPERQEATDLGMRIPLAVSPRKPRLDEPFQMLPLQPYTRPNSRVARKRTCSPPSGRSRRDGSARVHARLKTQMSSELDVDMANGLSDSDAGSVSVSSSRRAKSDQLASADISVDNIVEGGRRKRAKFESSVSIIRLDHASCKYSSLTSHLFATGTSPLCPTTDTNVCFHFFGISTAEVGATGFCIPPTGPVQLWEHTLAIPAELWLWRWRICQRQQRPLPPTWPNLRP